MLSLFKGTAARTMASPARTTALLLPSSRLAPLRPFHLTPTHLADVQLVTSSESRIVDLDDYAASKLKSGGLRNKVPQIIIQTVRDGGGNEALEEMCPKKEGQYLQASVDVYADPVSVYFSYRNAS